MKSKEELIKQVVVLVIALIITIVIAVVLNIGKGKEDVPEITMKENQEQIDTTDENNDELMDNLKGLLEPTTENEFEDSGTITEPIETGITEELRTNNNEIIQYQEIWNGDN